MAAGLDTTAVIEPAPTSLTSKKVVTYKNAAGELFEAVVAFYVGGDGEPVFVTTDDPLPTSNAELITLLNTLITGGAVKVDIQDASIAITATGLATSAKQDALVALLPTALGGNGGLKTEVLSFGGLDSATDSVDAKGAALGATNESAASTDTATSGLNGLTKRMLQKLTSLIALLPTALGAGGGLKVDGSGTALPVSGTVTTVGSGASDATVAGNPNLIAGRAGLALPSAATSGQAKTVWLGGYGQVMVGGFTSAATDTRSNSASGGHVGYDGQVNADMIYPYVFDGTDWNRSRSVINGQNTTGVGIAAAGIVGQLDDTSTGTVTENQFAPVRISPRRAMLVEANRLTVISQTPTLDTGIYASGDNLSATILTFANAVRANGLTGTIVGITILDKSTPAGASNPASLDVLLFDTSITVPAANAAANYSDADMAHCIGVIPVGSWTGTTINAVAQRVLSIPFKADAAATSIYAAVIVRGTPTWAASDLVFSLSIAQDA